VLAANIVVEDSALTTTLITIMLVRNTVDASENVFLLSCG
jgi:hypothetical protein